jgi:hypothetical protein
MIHYYGVLITCHIHIHYVPHSHPLASVMTSARPPLCWSISTIARIITHRVVFRGSILTTHLTSKHEQASATAMDVTIHPHRDPNFAVYQKECFKLSQHGLHPDFNTNPEDLEKQAQEALSKGGWLYASCNAGVSWTHRANREGE